MRVLQDKKRANKAIALGKRHSHMIDPELLSRGLSFKQDLKETQSSNIDNKVNKKIKVRLPFLF